MHAYLEGNGDPEVATATAAAGPPEILVLFRLRIRRDPSQLAVRRNDVDREKVVDAETVRARDETDAAAEHEAWDTDGRTAAADRNQAGVRGLQEEIKVAPAVAGLGPDNLPIEIEALGGHAGEVDHHSALVQTVTSRAMTAAAHSKRHFVLDGELVRGGDVVRD